MTEVPTLTRPACRWVGPVGAECTIQRNAFHVPPTLGRSSDGRLHGRWGTTTAHTTQSCYVLRNGRGFNRVSNMHMSHVHVHVHAHVMRMCMS